MVAVAGVLVHLGVLANGFAYDDAVLILGDPGIQSLSRIGGRLLEPSWPGAFGAEVGAWRPLTTLMWALTWSVSGGSALVFHGLGLALHAVASALVVLVLAELMPVLAATLGGLVFAVHPVHVEAVANIVGSAEPLATGLALGAVLIHLRAPERYGLGRAASVTLLYALAVLAKEGAAVLPLIFVLLDGARMDLDVRRLKPWLQRHGATYGMMSVALALLLVARSMVLGGVTSASTPPGGLVLLDIPRIWTVAGAWPHYFRLLFFPLDLSADYGPNVIPIAFGWSAASVTGVVLVAGTLFLAGHFWRDAPTTQGAGSNRLLGLGALWVAAALLPVANILYLGPVLVAERTLYLPSVGFALAAGWGLSVLHHRRKGIGLLVTVLVLAAGAVRSVARIPVWRSSDTVMSSLLDSHPESGRAWFSLGQRLSAEGRETDARRAFMYAVGILNSEYKETTEIASHLMATGHPESARLFLRRAWRERPEWPAAPGLLASIELNAGRFAEAEAAARAAAGAQPSNGSLQQLLAESLSRLGRHEEAAAARQASIHAGLGDRFRPWFLLSGDHMSLGNTSAALAALDSAALRAGSAEERELIRQARGELVRVPVPNE
jgi:hypothetical protein